MTIMPNPTAQPAPVLVIGIGNDYRHDDGVGLVVARALKQKSLPHLTIIESTGGGAELMDLWQTKPCVILIDAVSSNAEPGTFHQRNVVETPLPTNFLTQSSHAFGLAPAIELSRTLNSLPVQLLFLGVEGEDFSLGLGLSLRVQAMVPVVVEHVCQFSG
ncbi:hydrogenase maturation protease [Anaerolineales bacterium HSG6]|nr:hydrogenase maturation protease [Anaerolineales bacterium HSG6]